MKIIKSIALILLAAFLAFSCKKEKTNWDINASLPLAKGNLSVGNLVGDSLISTDSAGRVSVVFNKKFYNLADDSLYQIPDTTIENDLNLPVPISVGPGQTFYSNNNTTTYNLHGVELNYGIVESGTAIVKIVSSINAKTVVGYFAPSFSKNSQPLQLNAHIGAAPNGGTITYTRQIDLSGYALDLTGPNHNNVNTIYSNIVAKLDSSVSGNVTVPAGNPVKIYFTLENIVPYYIQGYFGNRTIHIADTTDLDIFNHIKGGSLNLDNAIVDVQLNNGAGIDAKLTIHKLSAINTSTNTIVSLTNSIIGNAINISRAIKQNGTPPVQYSNTDIHLDKNNSNSPSFVECLPNEFAYDLDLETDPLGNVSGGNDFLYKNYPLQNNLKVEIPLKMSLSDISLIDTFSVDLSEKGQAKSIKGAKIYADIENGFPLNATLKFDFLDEAGNLLFSDEFNNPIMPASGSGNSVISTNSQLTMIVSAAEASQLTNARKVVLTVKFNTSPANQLVQFYQNYFMKIDLYADFLYNVEE